MSDLRRINLEYQLNNIENTFDRILKSIKSLFHACNLKIINDNKKSSGNIFRASKYCDIPICDKMKEELSQIERSLVP